MTGSAAIRKGVKEGIDDARMSNILREIADKIGGDPTNLVARVEALEATQASHENAITELEDRQDSLSQGLDAANNRLERHRLRIRWLERWAHIHWPGWFPRPGL